MKLTVICEGAGWGRGTSGAMELSAWPHMLQYKRGETLTLDFPAGSTEERLAQTRIDQGVFTVLKETPPERGRR